VSQACLCWSTPTRMGPDVTAVCSPLSCQRSTDKELDFLVVPKILVAPCRYVTHPHVRNFKYQLSFMRKEAFISEFRRTWTRRTGSQVCWEAYKKNGNTRKLNCLIFEIRNQQFSWDCLSKRNIFCICRCSPCGHAGRYQCFGGEHCLHLQGFL
jgi:hypothetical protein